MLDYEVAVTDQDLKEAFKLRYEVFVEEQKVPEDMEIDEDDKRAIHVIAREGERIVGTGRLVIEENKGRIGRLAVSKDKRRQKIGNGLMEILEDQARQRRLTEVYLHAQTYAEEFYRHRGYLPRGEKFDEAGIEHQEMYKILTRS